MKKYFIILLMAMLSTLALAQQAGQHITRPTTKPKTEKPTTAQKQTTPKPVKKQSQSQPVGAGRSAMLNKTFTINGVSFTMVAVQGSTFKMGATNKHGSDTYEDERPIHKVTLSSFYIGQTEVTQELWQAVMGSNPSYFKSPKHPVEQVSWDDCQEFIKKLSSLTGQNFKLPTEAQWEYAARGGNRSHGYKYSGNNTLGSVAWYDDNSDNTTHNVATKQANELGIYDMSGNVWEWCQDWYGDYSSTSQTDPTGPYSGSNRVCRGGSLGTVSLRESETISLMELDALLFETEETNVKIKDANRVSNRHCYMPRGRIYNLGLRLAL